MAFEAGSFCVMDRGYVDFARRYVLHQAQAFFVTRAKSDLQYRRVYSHPVDKTTGLRCDQTIMLAGTRPSQDYPIRLRRMKFYDAKHDRLLVFLTNHCDLPALTIADLYRCPWRVKLFFKWIKQHLPIKRFFATSENAFKTQAWVAIAVYVLVAMVKKRMHCEASLYTILQIFSLTLFKKTPIDQLLDFLEHNDHIIIASNQPTLFD